MVDVLSWPWPMTVEMLEDDGAPECIVVAAREAGGILMGRRDIYGIHFELPPQFVVRVREV